MANAEPARPNRRVLPQLIGIMHGQFNTRKKDEECIFRGRHRPLILGVNQPRRNVRGRILIVISCPIRASYTGGLGAGGPLWRVLGRGETDRSGHTVDRAKAGHPRAHLRGLRHRPRGPENDADWSEVHRRACWTAARPRRSASPGDRVALLPPSGPDYLTTLLGAFYTRIIAVPLFSPSRPTSTNA